MMMEYLSLDVNHYATVIMAGVAALLAVIYLRNKRDNLPPGPFAFPIVGHLPQIILSGSVVNFCQKYKKIYGDVFTMRMGGYPRVVISGYDAMHQLLIASADHTSSRAITFTKYIKSRSERGLFFAHPSDWKAIRTFSLLTLRDRGMGRAAFEPEIVEEIEKYIEHYIEPSAGKPLDMYSNLPKATANVVSQLLFAKRFDYEDEAFTAITDVLNSAINGGLKFRMLTNLPLIGNIFPSVRKQRRNFLGIAMPVIKKCIEERKQQLDTNNPQCLVDQYLLSSDEMKFLTAENAAQLCFQLYAAGTETTSTTLRWALLYLCKNTDVLEKVQKEIDDNVGQRSTTYKDHLNMPYTDAVLTETQRLSNIVNSSLPHNAEKDIYVGGKLIPAESDLLMNMASVLYDPEVFEEPEKFKPERYLTGDITLKKKKTIPFGIGRRACLGESLAKVELFLFFVNFLQKYNIHLPEGSKVTTEPVVSVISAPKSYGIIFTPR